MAARKLGIVRHSLRPALSLLSPQPMPAQAFTDATAAAGRLEEIYERNTHFLRDHFEAR
jgi:AMP nucleosidase